MLKGLGNLGGLGDMAKMVKAAQEMQGKLAELNEELARTVVTGEAGAGLVTVRATAKGDITGLDIDPIILVASEKEVAEDLILAAVRDALHQGRLRTEQEMTKMATDLGIPPGTKLPF